MVIPKRLSDIFQKPYTLKNIEYYDFRNRHFYLR